jgi:hypothetical protein
MAEQSHLEAMREAIRGDLERARSRRPSIFERPAPPPVEIRRDPPAPVEPQPEPEPESAAVAEPEPESAAVAEPEPEPVTVAEDGSEPVAAEPEALAEAPEPRRGFRSRLAFWRRFTR